MSPAQNIVEVSEATFETEVIAYSRQVPVVVDFWAPWCGPCRMLGPILERLAGEAQGAFRLAKVNVDDNPGLAMRYGVQGIPAVKAFRDGRVVGEFVGAQPETAVRQFLRRIVPNEAARAQAEAERLLAAHRWAEAEAAYRRALSQDAHQASLALGLVKALLAQGKGQEAEQLLSSFSDGAEWAVAETLRPLARLLAEVQAGGNGTGAGELDALLHRGAQLIAQGDFPAAMEAFLEVLRRDKRYRQGQVRLAMLALFEILGESDPLTPLYRNKLASVLF